MISSTIVVSLKVMMNRGALQTHWTNRLNIGLQGMHLGEIATVRHCHRAAPIVGVLVLIWHPVMDPVLETSCVH
jgi:hypothetical protein